MPDYKARKLHVLKSLLFLAFFVAIHSHCYAWSGKVVGISDGDTIEILHNRTPERIRLYGIDCPEKRLAFGKKAKQFTNMKFHASDCKYYNCSKCTVIFNSRDEAIRAGYVPCKICKP